MEDVIVSESEKTSVKSVAKSLPGDSIVDWGILSPCLSLRKLMYHAVSSLPASFSDRPSNILVFKPLVTSSY